MFFVALTRDVSLNNGYFLQRKWRIMFVERQKDVDHVTNDAKLNIKLAKRGPHVKGVALEEVG